MNQSELKKLFKRSIKNGHINNNHLLPFSNSQIYEIKIKEEGYFRNFDLVIALIHKESTKKETYCSSKKMKYEYLDYNIHQNILMRTQQFTEFSKKEKCKIENITFIPVEIKSDNDILDERLPNQILNAILTFGRSYLVIDKRYVLKRNLQILKLLPTTIIGYSGKEDYFEVLSIFNRCIMNGIFNIPKRSFIKLLINNNITHNSSEMARIYRSLILLEQINQKLVYNYLFRVDEDVDTDFLLKEELDFLNQFCNFSRLPSEKTCTKEIKKLIKNSRNYLITDFL
ncbi:MAG TPA: hypothetical protein VJ583_06990 [Nitrososphaeraceae archaeon]|jgi:hypothetical protein|nr:hypothetical protein [Nitrososphaeraceae archaeon]